MRVQIDDSEARWKRRPADGAGLFLLAGRRWGLESREILDERAGVTFRLVIIEI